MPVPILLDIRKVFNKRQVDPTPSRGQIREICDKLHAQDLSEKVLIMMLNLDDRPFSGDGSICSEDQVQSRGNIGQNMPGDEYEAPILPKCKLEPNKSCRRSPQDLMQTTKIIEEFVTRIRFRLSELRQCCPEVEMCDPMDLDFMSIEILVEDLGYFGIHK